MTVLAVAVRGAGGQDLFTVEPVMKESFAYLAPLQTPHDPSTGFHMLPTVGHVTIYGWCQALQTHFPWAAKATASTDPPFSRRMMAAASGPALGRSPCATGSATPSGDSLCSSWTVPSRPSPTQPGRTADCTGAWAPCSAPCTPGGTEAYLLAKMGPARGHYDADEGSLFSYAWGVPLLADFGFRYNPNIQCSWLRSRIAWDRWGEAHGHHFEVLGCGLGGESDSVYGEMTVDRLERWDDWPVRRAEAHHHLFPPPRTWPRRQTGRPTPEPRVSHDCPADAGATAQPTRRRRGLLKITKAKPFWSSRGPSSSRCTPTRAWSGSASRCWKVAP